MTVKKVLPKNWAWIYLIVFTNSYNLDYYWNLKIIVGTLLKTKRAEAQVGTVTYKKFVIL